MFDFQSETLAFLFFVSVFFLYLLKKAISRQLQLLSLFLFHTSKFGFWLYVVLAFPGVVLHELSHWLMAEILQVPTDQIKLLPSSPTNPVRCLGSVQTAKTDPFRGLLIGLAPFITGLLSLFALVSYLPPLSTLSWKNLFFLYLIWTISHGMLVSRSDLRFFPFILFLLTLFFLLVRFWHFNLSFQFLINPLTLILKVLVLAILVGLVFLICLLLLRFVFQFTTHSFPFAKNPQNH